MENGRVTRVDPNPAHPASRGAFCVKGIRGLSELTYGEKRLRHPLRRVGERGSNQWEPISWDTALDEAAKGLHAVQQRHGTNAVGVYLGNPNVHNTGSLLMAALFVRALKTKHRYSATSVDQLPHMLVAYWMFGHQLMLPVPD